MADDPVEWAKTEANRLRGLAASREVEEDIHYASAVRYHAAAAIEFLRIHAGNTDFYRTVEDLFTTHVTPPAALAGIAELLDLWVDFRQRGMAATVPFEARARIEAANDLMEQVQGLLDDRDVHPAAPVMLAGAALEEFLRSMVATYPAVVVKSRLGLQAYAEALVAAGVLSKQDVKDITAMAGHRNDAAHGQFDRLSAERARLMADMVNLFIRQHTTPSP